MNKSVCENCIPKCIVISLEKNLKNVDFFKPDHTLDAKDWNRCNWNDWNGCNVPLILFPDEKVACPIRFP